MSYNRSMDIGAMAKGIDCKTCFGENDEDVIQWALNNRMEFDEFVIVGNFPYLHSWAEENVLDSLRRYRKDMELPNTRVILMTSPARVSDVSDQPQMVVAEQSDLPHALRRNDAESDEDTVNDSSESEEDSSDDHEAEGRESANENDD
ncbi:hypothetical protein AAVH_24940 [Aphelenchoides avenae]|nr:hypothetical protein AAVH_24940 [Aphelenchus avenae]